MTAPRIEHAKALAATVRAALDAAGLDAVMASIDPLDIPSGARHGIVVVSPPDLTFPTFTQTDVTRELVAVAGPADNLLAAWTRLDEIIEALRVAGLELDSARGDMVTVKAGNPLPAYTITLTADTLID